MIELFDEVQGVILSARPDYSGILFKITQKKSQNIGKELVQTATIERLVMILRDFLEERSGLSELAIILRQTIRIYNRKINIPISLWTLLEGRAPDFHLWGLVDPTRKEVELHADDWQPYWLNDVNEIDRIESRHDDETVPGDGLLFGATGKTRYLSQAQKDAVEACLNVSPGATLLVSLPTGSGKSHCMLLPSWVDSHGGRRPGGTTLVIVPTVALALDQERRANEFFKQAYNEEYRPWSLVGSTIPQNRFLIREGLRKGTLPLLFTSPESVMNSEIFNICMEAARQGHLRRLVIDEAHIVETWGAGFRTEFQFLSTFRNKLLQESKIKPVTFLLSATVSRYTVDLLKTLFSDGENFFHISANRLRAEISYWFSRVNDDELRIAHLLEALYHLPRPAILYVNRPDDAEGWVERLRQQGFRRLAAFSGNTDPRERERILNEWQHNNLDLIVATSAFGLGVDKADVRTVIHAALPENLDRFYQEVGRGGRDGMSSISLLCTCDRDYERTFATLKSSRITVEKALERWEGMLATREFISDREMLIDLNAVPASRPELFQGELNRDWNTHILLLMQRAKLINIVETRIDLPNNHSDGSQSDKSDELMYKVLVRVKDGQVTNDMEKLRQSLEVIRSKEARGIRESLRDIDQLAYQFSTNPNRCVGYRFMRLYEKTGLACGGCPTCRVQKRLPYSSQLNSYINQEIYGREIDTISIELQNRLQVHQTLNLFWSGTPSPKYLMEKLQLFVLLVKFGMRQIILPDELFSDRLWTDRLIKAMAQNDEIIHRIISFRHSQGRSLHSLFPIPTVVVYGSNEKEIDLTYKTVESFRKNKFKRMPIVNLVYRDMKLNCEAGTFLNRVNGQNDHIENFERNIIKKEDIINF